MRTAEAIGQLLAARGITLVTGGRGGVMEAASRGAHQGGGLVVGILPGDSLEGANPWCTVVIPTGLGHARNAVNALAGDLVIAVGGSAGTLSEICFAWLQGKPILALCGQGGWAEELAGKTVDPRPRAPLLRCEGLEELERELDSLLLRLR